MTMQLVVDPFNLPGIFPYGVIKLLALKVSTVGNLLESRPLFHGITAYPGCILDLV